MTPTAEELLNDLLYIVRALGWSIAIPRGEDEELVPGMIIGEESYVQKILEEIGPNFQWRNH